MTAEARVTPGDPVDPAGPASPWRGGHLRTTVGLFALAFLFAFEALAVATVMPDVARDLDGLSWYAVAFAAPLASAVVALTLAGPWIDARGPSGAVSAGVAVFVAGVLLAGAAPSMPLFLAGRLVHGFGGGVVSVALYVVVAQAYPEHLRARVFTVFTSAWVLPALVGPVVAAYVAQTVGWRWVFLGVPVLALVAWLLVRDASAADRGGEAPRAVARVPLNPAVLAAVGVLVISVAGQRDLPVLPDLWPVLLGAATVVVVLAGLRLLPRGSWSGGRGLPSIIGTRGLVGASFMCAEAYVPLLLTLDRGLSLAQAGWVLTIGAVTWFGGSWAAGRLRWLADEVHRVRLGVVLIAVGIAGFTTVALPGVPLLVPVLGWGVAGAGIGMAFSTLSVLTLAAAPAGEAGRASSALQLNDSVVQALLLALGSALFAGFATGAPATGALVLVAASAAVGAFALLPATRMR